MLILKNELFSDAGDISRINFLDSESAFLWDYIYTKFLNGEEISAEEILASDIPESSRNAIAPFMVESDDYRDSEIEDKRNIFEQLFHQQKIFVHQAEMEQLVLKKTYSEEEEYAKISEIVFHRTEIEKHHDSIRNSSFTTT
ncbi:MAG: hypothetical protein K8R21_00340 [Leptospira sp.]|nr:hypothetical protein [Leptospira sp.]